MGLDDFHSSDNSVETDPKHYSVVFDTSLGEMRAAIYKGKNPWALLVDTASGEIYVGDHHKLMQERHNVPVSPSLYEGFFEADENFQDVQLKYLSEWRGRQNAKMVENGPFKSAIAEAIKRDFRLKAAE